MDTRKFVFIAMLLVVSAFVFAVEGEQISFTWSDITSVVLDKAVFNDTEPITGKLAFTNLENYPSLGTKIVLHLVQGEYSYPSQLNLSENILEEKIMGMNFVLPQSKKEVSFTMNNPGNGRYRIDAYVWVIKSKGSGASNIMYNPISSDFEVSGNKKERAAIDRENTIFGDAVGPIGFPVDPESKFTGTVAINNDTSTEKNNLAVGIKICEWASAFCTNETESRFSVDPIAAGQKGKVNVELTAPKIPSAYEIGITLYSGNSVESIYKSRVIVSGGTAKIRKIMLDGLADRNYSLNLVVIGSPDHFAYPDFSNFEISVDVYNNNSITEKKSSKVSMIKTGDTIQQAFMLDSVEFTKFCAKVVKEGVVYENECFDADLNQMLYEYDLLHPKKIEAEFEYDNFSKTLSVTLKRASINAQVRIFDSFETYYKEEINASGEYVLKVPIEKLNLFLMINDFDLKTQELIPMNLALDSDNGVIYGDTTDTNSTVISKKCAGKVCSKNTSCDTKTTLTAEGECCYTECVKTDAVSKQFLQIPLIFWVALIVLIVAIAIVYEIMQKRGNKK